LAGEAGESRIQALQGTIPDVGRFMINGDQESLDAFREHILTQ
jgi:hypothetical protein